MAGLQYKTSLRKASHGWDWSPGHSDVTLLSYPRETVLNLNQKVALEKAGDLMGGNKASMSHPHRRLFISKLHMAPTDIICSPDF